METSEERNRRTIAGFYEAFGRGAIDEILAHYRDDVVLEPGLDREVAPWIRPGTGKAAATEFFRIIGEELQFEHFEPLRIFASGDEVVVTLREHVVVRATGKVVHEDPAIHVWRLDEDGRVRSMRHVVDTQVHHDAAQVDAAPADAVQRGAVPRGAVQPA
jgi:ketosteroid isomerase-like protein